MPDLQRGSWDKVSTCTNSYLQVFPHILALRSLGERERSNAQCAALCKEEGTLHKILVLVENQLKLACALWFLLAKASTHKGLHLLLLRHCSVILMHFTPFLSPISSQLCFHIHNIHPILCTSFSPFHSQYTDIQIICIIPEIISSLYYMY